MFPKQRALTIIVKEVKGTTAKQTHQSKRLKAIALKKDRGNIVIIHPPKKELKKEERKSET
jgi:hypothetical protein